MATIPEVFQMAVSHYQAGRLQAAEQSCRQALAVDPNQADAWNLLGVIHAQCGSQQAAADCLRRAIGLTANVAAFHNNLGGVYRALTKRDDAVACYRRALELSPGYPEAHFNLGITLREQGKVDEAIDSYRRAIKLNPDFAEARYNLGNARLAQGKWDEAIVCFRRALELKPEIAELHISLGNALQCQGKLDEAAACFRRALELKPKFAEVHNNLGNILKEQGKLDEAVAHYRRTLELKPDFAEARNDLGNILQDQGKLDEALACYRRALELKPDFAEAHNNLAIVLREQGKWDEAVACYRRALELKPNIAEIHNNLGSILQEQGKLDEALACYRRALELKPDFAQAQFFLGTILREQGKRDETVACYRRAVELKPDYGLAMSALVNELQHLCQWEGLQRLSERVIEFVCEDGKNANASQVSPFAFLALPAITTAEQQLRCARQWAGRRLKAPVELPHGPAWIRPKDGKSKMTVGYLSADFHSHATAQLTAELFEKHDRDHFFIIGYSFGRDDSSPMRRRLVNAFDRFVDLKDAPFREAAEHIAADEVRIAVDLKGYTTGSREEILSLRPAPIQVNYLGYPGTMGASFVDYILVDDFVVPPEQQPFYTEKLVHLPGCYQVNDSQREISPRTPSRAECGLPPEGFVFCCFNNNYKITPEVFGVWMKLLQAVPGSVLWLLEGNRFAPPNLRREAEARGVAAERLVFAPRVDLAQHLARHRLADLFLDTIPYNAHTTASEALWAGCPLLTIAGETFASRVAGSLLRTLGLPELITTRLDEYEQLALRLARDPKQLADLRARLRTNKSTSALFDGGRFATTLEKAYGTMWEIYASGKKPCPFRVSPA